MWAIGDSASFTKTLSESDVYMFAGITGDFNPMHVDDVAARASRFGTRIAHGMLGASLLCTVLGTKLPGPGTIHVGQTLDFKSPVRFGDTLTAHVQIVDLGLDKGGRRMRLKTWVTNQDGVVVVEGEAVVVPPPSNERGSSKRE